MINLVAKMKADGEPLDSIREHFMKRGLPDEQIEEILSQADAMEQKEFDKEVKRSKQMVITGIICFIVGGLSLYLDHFVFDDAILLMILGYILLLFGLANVVYGYFNNPQRKQEREAKK